MTNYQLAKIIDAVPDWIDLLSVSNKEDCLTHTYGQLSAAALIQDALNNQPILHLPLFEGELAGNIIPLFIDDPLVEAHKNDPQVVAVGQTPTDALIVLKHVYSKLEDALFSKEDAQVFLEKPTGFEHETFNTQLSLFDEDATVDNLEDTQDDALEHLLDIFTIIGYEIDWLDLFLKSCPDETDVQIRYLFAFN